MNGSRISSQVSGVLIAACLALVWVGGCLDSETDHCAWGEICPPGKVCHGPSQRCLLPEQITACHTKGDGEYCDPETLSGWFVCVAEACLPSVCGDGVWDGRPEVGESCDDGNQDAGDGCRADCRGRELCGDGEEDFLVGEECDDGTANSNTQPDACRADCALARCGDGVIDSSEECDDATLNSDILPGACRTDCLHPGCGDGVMDASEVGLCWEVGPGAGTVAGSRLADVVLADLDGDEILDVLVPAFDSGHLAVYLSDGQGGLVGAPGAPHPTGPGPVTAVVGDFDQDSEPDVVVATRGGTLPILLGQGNGRLSWHTSLQVAGRLTDMAAADVDADGLVDLLITDADHDELVWLAGDGAGSFVQAGAVSVGATGFDPNGLAIGDVDADGHVDVAVANRGFHQVSLLQGDGSGNFTMVPGFPVDVGVSWRSVVRDVALADVDGNGQVDILYVDGPSVGDAILGVLLNQGGLSFVRSDLVLSLGPAVYGIKTADLDLDGDVDVVGSGVSPPLTYFAIGDDSGGFARVLFAPYGLAAGGVALGDLDGDGYPDLVISGQHSGQIGVFLNKP